MQEVELAQQKEMVSQVSIRGQPSITSTMSKPTKFSIVLELDVELWNWESRGHVPKNNFSTYHSHCQFFMLITCSKRYD